MTCSRLFVCWAISMCLAACLCASSKEDVKLADKKATQKSVTEMQMLTEKVLVNATRLRNHAEFLIARAKTNNHIAQDAISHVSKATSNNPKAVEIATKVKETSKEVIEMYENAIKAANKSFQSMRNLVKEAEQLKNETYNDTERYITSLPKETDLNNTIKNIKAKVEEFQKTLQEEKKKNLLPASKQEIHMSNLVQTIKVGKYNYSVIQSVTEIDTAGDKAEIDIDKTKKKMNEDTNTLTKLREMSTRATKSTNAKINKVIQEAQSALDTATKAVDDAKKLKKETIKIKTKAHASHAKFTDTTTPIQVVGEVSKTENYVEEVTKKTNEIATALQSAESAAESTKSATQSILNLLSPGNTQQSGEMTKDSEVLLKSATDTFQHSLNVNPRINTLKRTVTGTSENSLQQESDTLTVGKGQQPNVNNLSIPKDQLTKRTHYGRKIPSVNRKHSSGGASGDGSMILSVPLLAALVASAVLH